MLEPLAEPISAEAIRILKCKRRKTRYCGLALSTPSSLGAAGWSNEDGQLRDDSTLEPTPSISNIETVSGIDDGKEMTGLELSIKSLRSKLEMLQPEGMRPSDIAAATAQISAQDGINIAAPGPAKDESADNDVLLSQTATSQRSILLWDEICAIIEAMDSTNSRLQSMVSEVLVPSKEQLHSFHG